jgi:hypothetical protein
MSTLGMYQAIQSFLENFLCNYHLRNFACVGAFYHQAHGVR